MNTVELEYDVAVIGAGPGGVPAALAAARQGARVFLGERNGYVGGNAALGLPWLAFLDKSGRRVVGGIAQEFVDVLTERGMCYGHRACPMHNSVTVYQPDAFKLAALEMLRDAGVDLLLHSEVMDVEVENGSIRRVVLFGKGNRVAVRAKVFIDATGDGDMAYLSGARYEKGQEGTGVLQPPTVMFTLGGVDNRRFFAYLAEHPDQLTYGGAIECGPGYDAAYFAGSENHVFVGLRKLLGELRERGECPIDRDTFIYINSPNPGEIYVNSTRLLGVDATDLFSLTRGEVEGQLQIPKLVEMLRRYLPGYEGCYLSNIMPGIGVRESRRFAGMKYLTGPQILAAEVPEDTIALGSYKIDIHSGTDDSTVLKEIIHPYGIPYGCLVSSDFDNLMLSGRCISMDAEVLGSERVMPICMAVGQAAGVGAALACGGGVRPGDVPAEDVRKILLRNKAILT